MILGVGSDIVEVDRVKKAWERTGDHFLKRVFTQLELEYCRAFADPWPHLAARFAAKESVIKALGRPLDPSEIEVFRNAEGPPVINLHGTSKLKAEDMGVREVKVSLSHTKNLAHAQAIALG